MQEKNKKQNIYHRILKPAFSIFAILSLSFSNLSPLLAESQKEKSFDYGVLAVNTEKAFYEPGEEILVQMASLDNTGNTLCNSNLQLEIMAPDGTSMTYKTYTSYISDAAYETNTSNNSDNLIINSPTCGDNNVTDEPDYTARYIVPSAEGIYRIILKNSDTNLETTNIFQVKNNLPFSVGRKTATRINPFKSAYRVEIFITANKDFVGQAEELVQEGFEISNFGIAKKSNYVDPNLGNFQKLIWPVAIKKGQSISLSYIYSAPKISPEFFRIGYLQLRSATVSEILSGTGENFSGVLQFSEGRPWQIASDITVSGIVFDEGEATNLGSGYALKLAVGASTVYNATTTAGGAFSFNVSSVNAGDILTIWLSTTTKGTLVLKYGSGCTGYSDCTSLAVVKNQVRLDNKHTGNMAISDLTACNNTSGSVCSNTDIGFIATSGPSASSTLSWQVNILKVNTGVTFAPGGNVTAQKLSVAGTYTGGSETITVTGGGTSSACTDADQTALCVSGTFTPNSNTVKYTGISTSSIPTLNYNNLELAPSSAGNPTYTLASNDGGSDGWYSTGGTWDYRKAITIDKTKVSTASGTALSNFPVLLHIAGDNNLKFTSSGGNVASSTGGDIVITASDGTTKLNYEIEKYASTTGEIIAWVKVPTLSTTTDTTLYMYYGNASAPYNATTTGVWDSNYAAVYHLSENLSTASANYKDSTSNANNATLIDADGDSTASTKIAGSVKLNGDADNFVATHHSSMNIGSGSFTVSLLHKRIYNWGDAGTLVSKLNSYSSANTGFRISKNGGALTFVYQRGGGDTKTLTTDTSYWTGDDWIYTHAVYDASASALYVYRNGTLYTTLTGVTPANINNTIDLHIGVRWANGYAAYDNSDYDEVRLVKSAYSPDWIATEYASYNSTSTFYSVGSQEAPIIITPSIVANILVIGDGANPVTVSAYTNNASSTILGNFTINSNATYVTASSSPLNLAGNFTNNGTFTHSNGTTTFISTSGTKTISGSSTFYNLLMNGSGGVFDFSTATTTVENNLIVSAGTLQGTGSINIQGGTVSGNGTINLTGGTFTLNGTGNFGGNTAWIFNNLTFGATASTTQIGTATTTISGVLTNSGSLDAGSRVWTLSGSGTPFVNNGIFYPGTSTFNYTATSNATVTNASYYNLSLAPGGTPTYTIGEALAPSDWYSTEGTWNYRKAITIDKTKVSTASGTALSDFPVLVHIAGDNNLKFTGSGGNVASSTGGDIVITASDGTTKLNYEIEKYASSTGETIAWVKVPTLSTTTDTTLYMYYGNASAPYNATTTGVWSNGYVGVWHLGDGTTLNLNDSTSNANNGSPSNVSVVAGKIGGAASFNGSTSSINVGSASSLDNIGAVTYSAWIYVTGAGQNGYGFIYSKTPSGSSNGPRILTVDNPSPQNRISFGFNSSGSAQLPVRETVSDIYTRNSWAYVVGTWDGSLNATGLKIYVDGTEATYVTTSNGVTAIVSDASDTAFIGNRSGGARTFNGRIDNMRVYAGVRSSDWIITEYNNQNSTSTFYSVGEQEVYIVSEGFMVNNNFTVGNGSNAVAVVAPASGITINGTTTLLSGTLNLNTNNAPATFVGNLTFAGTLSAPSSATFILQGNFTNNGTFTHNNGTVTITPVATSTVAGSAVTNFYNLTSNAPFKELRFKNGQQLGVAGLLTLSGWESAPLDITSDSFGVQWLLNLTGTANYNYIRIRDSGCSAGSVSQTEKVTDRGNNSGSCWGLIIRGGGGGGLPPRDGSTGGGDQQDGGGEDGGADGGGGGGGDQQDGGGAGGGGGAAP